MCSCGKENPDGVTTPASTMESNVRLVKRQLAAPAGVVWNAELWTDGSWVWRAWKRNRRRGCEQRSLDLTELLEDAPAIDVLAKKSDSTIWLRATRDGRHAEPIRGPPTHAGRQTCGKPARESGNGSPAHLCGRMSCGAHLPHDGRQLIRCTPIAPSGTAGSARCRLIWT